MTCTCGQSPAGNVAPASGGNEVSGSGTLVDKAIGFSGTVTKFANPPYVTVKTATGGTRVEYHLVSLTQDLFDRVTDGDLVVGAFRPTLAAKDPNPSSSSANVRIVNGICDVIQSFSFTIDRLSTLNTSANLNLTQQAMAQLVAVGQSSSDDAILKSQDAVQLLALMNAICDMQVLTTLSDQATQGYLLYGFDVVPGRPGTLSGVVHVVFRMIKASSASQKALLFTLPLRVAEDFDLPIPFGIGRRARANANAPQTEIDVGSLLDTSNRTLEFVDPLKWTPERCAACRKACAAYLQKCMDGCSRRSGIEAVECLLLCQQDVDDCFKDCTC